MIRTAAVVFPFDAFGNSGTGDGARLLGDYLREVVEDAELVAGHAPRTIIRTVGPEATKRDVLALIKRELPQANVFFWITPVIEAGRL